MLSGKTLKRLVIITAICAVPVVILTVKSGASSIKNRNIAYMPDLLKKKEQITKIILQDNKQTLTLQKTASGWQALERSNYMVLTTKVDELLYSLADLRVVEPKTSNPEMYKQLDVNDVEEDNSESLLITVNDIYNDSVAKVYIGKREGVRLGEDYKEHIFVRKAGDAQAWLVQGAIPLSNDFSDWVEQPLLGILEGDQVKSVEISKAQSDKVVIARDKQEQEDFALQDTQARNGMILDLDAVNTVPFEIAELEFKDVRKANSSIEWSKGITATVETFPGVKLVLNLVKDQEKVLAKVEARALDSADAELQQKIQNFNTAKQGWVYELSPEIYKELALSNDDFFKLKEEIIPEAHVHDDSCGHQH